MKNIVASTAVARDRKFAEPVAPKRLPEAPPPKPEPMSAPLPCWTSTKPMIASATITCSTMRTVVSISIHLFGSCSLEDRQKIFRHQRCAADEAPIDVRHRENRRRVLRLDAPAVEDRRLLLQPLAQECVYCLCLLRRRVAACADRPYGLIGEQAIHKLHRGELPRHHFLRLSRFTFREGLAHAQDRR